jgi:hypothetical protein
MSATFYECLDPGVLDFVRYAAKKGIEVDPPSNYGISLTQIKEMIEEITSEEKLMQKVSRNYVKFYVREEVQCYIV